MQKKKNRRYNRDDCGNIRNSRKDSAQTEEVHFKVFYTQIGLRVFSYVQPKCVVK